MLDLNCVPTYVRIYVALVALWVHARIATVIVSSLGQRLSQGREINSMGLGRERGHST